MRDLKVVKELYAVGGKLYDAAIEMMCELEEAVFAARMASFQREDDFINYSIDAGTYTELARKRLEQFDKELLRLIALRGKLAEATGIPIGGKQWVRLEQYEM